MPFTPRCGIRKLRRGATGAVAAALALAPAASTQAEWHGDAIDLMGTRVSVELWHDDTAAGEALVERVLDEYRRVDSVMSTYRDDSAVSRVNRDAAAAPVRVSAELFGLVGRALELSEASGGAFDITYDSVGRLYDFRAGQRPDAAEIDASLGAVDYRHVVLDAQARTIALREPGVRINLGGIAKGHAVERGAALLAEAGVEHAFLSAGGDTRVIGDRRGQPWIVGIRHPRDEAAVVTRLPLIDEAISTSGDYERFFEADGERYHHILNPSTGRPSDALMSVTVIGADATLTDGLATTVFVLGTDRGLDLVERHAGYEAVVIERDGTLSYSSGLEPGG